MSPASIQPMAAQDIECVAAIHGACFEDSWSGDMIRRVLGTAGAFGLVARPGGAAPIAAFALGRIVVDECELLSLGVAPLQRRQGLGAALLDAALARSAAMRVRRFFLEVGEFNSAARRLYESRGLRIVGRREDYYTLAGGAMDALTMRCEPVLPARRHPAAPAAERAPGASPAMSSRS